MRLFVSTFALFCLAACQTSLYRESTTVQSLLIPDNVRLAPPKILDESDVDQDVDLLVFALNEGYAGRDHMRPETFDREIRELRKIRGPLLPAQLRDEIDEILLELPDSHLIAKLQGRASRPRTAENRAPAVGPNRLQDPKRVWDVRTEVAGGKKALVVAISHFASSDDATAWSGFLEAVRAQLPRSDFMVLDLRGNTGGDDGVGLQLVSLLQAKEYPLLFSKKHRMTTPEASALRANAWRLKALRAKVDGHGSFEMFEERSKAEAANLLPQPARFETKDFGLIKPSGAGYTKPIYILVDAACASSCESVAAALESHPQAKRVGEATAGFVFAGEIGALLLPASRIEVQIPTTVFELSRALEKKGLAPDIAVPPGQDALTYLFTKVVK